MRSFAIASLLVASASSALAASLFVHNWCDAAVYAWSVADSQGPMQTIGKHGGVWSTPYLTRRSGGVSVKVGASPADIGRNNVLQFEYTNANGLWYDLSYINGAPFASKWVVATPTRTDRASCNVLTCAPGASCKDAYQRPDDIQTHFCAMQDVHLDLCANSKPAGALRRDLVDLPEMADRRAVQFSA